jgi:DNA-directed RNA polymerase subunit RPC12/RpoP
MNALPNSHDFSERYRIAYKRERIASFVAIAPGFLYVIQHMLRDSRPIPGLTLRVDEWLLYLLWAWAALVLFAFTRGAWKRAGLVCPKCKHEFRKTSFDSVMARGLCPNCSTKILADVGSMTATSMEEFAFRHPRGRAVFLLLSAVVVAGFGVLMVIGFTSILFD